MSFIHRSKNACRTAATAAAELNFFILLLFCPFGKTFLLASSTGFIGEAGEKADVAGPLLCISADMYDKFVFAWLFIRKKYE
jgi:hypothetical protein